MRPLLTIRLVCLNDVANGIFCDRGIGLHMYGQMNGFFDREGGSYAGQSISVPIVSSLNFFDCPLSELL